MAERGQQRLAGDLRGIEAEQESEALIESAAGHCVAHEDQQQHGQARHHPAHGVLDTLLHALGDDPQGQQRNQQAPATEFPGLALCASNTPPSASTLVAANEPSSIFTV